MDSIKTGRLIRELRTKAGLTQKQLADRLNVTDKAVSKWETGGGCPDISVITALAELFGADVSSLLAGEINQNESEIGNMKKMKFYICPDCGNIIFSSSEATVSCCGKKLSPLEPKKAEESEMLSAEHIDGELYISSDHPMTKDHYISFVAYVGDNTAIVCKQYPEWNLQASLPPYNSGRLVWYCTKCGLFYQDIRPAKK